MYQTPEFAEIAHSGGKIVFTIRSSHDGVGYQVGYSSSRPVPTSLIQIYALPQGIPVGTAPIDGIGDNSPPPAGCFQIFVASDSEGKFGHDCPRCHSYWRSGPHPNRCPYCAHTTASHNFLSRSQRKYVAHCCEILDEALSEGQDGDYEIDMDGVADALGNETADRPAFYVSERSQQRKFICEACGEFNDILGRYGYCSLCGTRSDFQDFEEQIATIRSQLNALARPEDTLRSAVAAYDSFVGQYAKELARLVPMTKARRTRLVDRRFHDLNGVRGQMKEWFDIDICSGIKDSERQFAAVRFHRRHLFEHHGGEVTAKYIEDSGDQSVVVKQVLHERAEDVHLLLGTLLKLARNLHGGFHELFPAAEKPIKWHQDNIKRQEQWRRSTSGPTICTVHPTSKKP